MTELQKMAVEVDLTIRQRFMYPILSLTRITENTVKIICAGITMYFLRVLRYAEVCRR